VIPRKTKLNTFNFQIYRGKLVGLSVLEIKIIKLLIQQMAIGKILSCPALQENTAVSYNFNSILITINI
jgi:hypothetical protein